MMEVRHEELLTAIDRFHESGLHEHLNWIEFADVTDSKMTKRDADFYFMLPDQVARRVRMLNSPHYRTLVRAWLINWMEEKRWTLKR